jgi:ribose-phosphate pyrophosphokinase
VSAVIIQSLPSGVSDAKRLAARLGVAAAEISIHRFPDGELGATVAPPTPVTIIYASLDRPNEKLVALLFAVEALRRNGAKRLVLVAPYLCYMRQDIAFQPGEAISQKAIGGLLAGLVDRVITVDAHLHRTADIRWRATCSRSATQFTSNNSLLTGLGLICLKAWRHFARQTWIRKGCQPGERLRRER